MPLTMASSQMIEMSWWGSLEVKYFFHFFYYIMFTVNTALVPLMDGCLSFTCTELPTELLAMSLFGTFLGPHLELNLNQPVQG